MRHKITQLIHPQAICFYIVLLSTVLLNVKRLLVYANRHEKDVPFICTSNRHVHLSSKSDASTSIIISFSSYPCDVSVSSKYVYYDLYKNRQPNIHKAGVIVSTDRDNLHVNDNHTDKNNTINDRRIVYIDYNDNDEKGINGATRYYNATIDLHKERIEYRSEYQHHVIVTDLNPNTKYYYKCIVEIETDVNINSAYGVHDDDNDEYEYEEYYRKEIRRIEAYQRNTLVDTDDNEDAIFSFKTAPPRNDKNAPTKFAILGDLGVFDHTKETLGMLATKIDDFDFIILVGDISYANSDHRVWDQFFNMMDDMKMFTRKVRRNVKIQCNIKSFHFQCS